MRFHFVRHGRRGLSNEVAVDSPTASQRGAGEIRIEDFREIVQLFKGLFAGYPQIGRFWPLDGVDEVSSGPKLRFCQQKIRFSPIKLPKLPPRRTIEPAVVSAVEI